MRGSYCSWLLFLVASTALHLGAQTTSTEILGRVTDATGGVLPGAKVTITRVATGETRSAVTNHVGEYGFPLIEIGEYRVQVEMPGFGSQVVKSLRSEERR